MIITRFAPSPTGLLHLGHVHAAWFAWRHAREAGGRFLLRIEDIDRGRCRPAWTEAIQEDLHWLGLHWDGEVLVQSERLALYEEALTCLRRHGLLYPCFCSRQDILREIEGSAAAPHGPDGAPLYPGTCKRLGADEREARLSAGSPHAWRLDMEQALSAAPALSFIEEEPAHGLVACQPHLFGDVVLARRDCPGSYHLCVTHDDAAQQVTLVTRGMDLRPATGLHRLLQHLMGWHAPAYAHHRLIRDADGRRLAKRDPGVSVRDLRASGRAAAEVLRLAGGSPV